MSARDYSRFNTGAGVVLSVSGLICIGISAYLFIVPPPPIPVLTHSPKPATLPSCERTLRRLGFMTALVSEQNGSRILEARKGFEPEASGEDARTMLAEASLAIQGCRMKLVKFCMGFACEKGAGVTVELAPDLYADSSDIQMDAAAAPPPGGATAPVPVAPRPRTPRPLTKPPQKPVPKA